MRPGAVGVWVVALPGDPVDADLVAQGDPGVVIDEAGREVAAEDVGRRQPTEVGAGPGVVMAVRVIHALEGVGNPADATLGEGDDQIGELA